MSRDYRVVLFDLFGTVVHFVGPPRAAARGVFDWLRDPLATRRPAIPFDEFRRALVEVSAAIVAERPPDHREIPSRERFQRVLARFEPQPDSDTVEALSLAHMAHLAAQTSIPDDHSPLLREISSRYRLGLVSNFDHAPTAQSVLARHGVHRYFDVTLISDDFGRRKPHPSIFQEALARLGAEAHEALYVGDSAADDVVGAHAAGLDVVWLNPAAAALPTPPPTYELRDLSGLRRLLELA